MRKRSESIAPAKLHCARHVAVNINRLAVLAVAGEIRDIVVVVELLDSSHDRIQRTIKHQA
jgi:hypothetical protein